MANIRKIDSLLRGIGAAYEGPSIGTALWIIILASPLYGMAMGAFDVRGERALYSLYSAVKMPVMILATAAICLPGFIVLNTVLGLRDDLRQSLRAIACSQATFALAISSLAPFTLLVYASGVDHRWAVLFNGLMFFLATLMAQRVLWSRYRPLLDRSAKHTVLLFAWVGAYVFVGVQTGWMLRPFIGTPGFNPSFFRSEPFSNAYVVVWHLIIGGS